jgi:hypothetical protein
VNLVNGPDPRGIRGAAVRPRAQRRRRAGRRRDVSGVIFSHPGEQLQHGVADVDPIAGSQRFGMPQRRAVEQRPVARAEVFDPPAIVAPDEPGVLPRHARIGDHDRGGRGPSDDHFGSRQRVVGV